MHIAGGGLAMTRCLAYVKGADIGPMHWFRRLRWQVRLAAGLFTCLMLPVLFHGWYVAFGGNLYAVVPGVIYRSAQPSAADLQTIASSCGIRTVINLRGDTDEPWYDVEHDTARTLNVQVVDVGLWATQPPPADQFRLLVDTLADVPGPILVHCRAAATGRASRQPWACFGTDGTIDDARRQLSLYYGHNPYGRAACNDRVLTRYEEWLANNGWQHSPARLREWAETAYLPSECW